MGVGLSESWPGSVPLGVSDSAPARGRHGPMLGASWGLGGLCGHTGVLAQDRRPLCSWTPQMCLSPGRRIPVPSC